MTTDSESPWLETARMVVFPAHCDHLGHMNVRFYAQVFDEASFHIWARAGITYAMMTDHGVVTVVARNATDYLKEVRVGSLLLVESAFVKLGTRSVTYRQRLRNAEDGGLHAVQEAVEVVFDPKTRSSAPMPDAIRERITAALKPGADPHHL